MIRLFKIEFSKLWNARYFKVLGILWLVAFLSVPFLGDAILNWLQENVPVDEFFISPGNLPIFDFVDIWQNLGWVYKKITILLSFVVIISVTNDLDYRIARQNIIDGLSRKEFWLSKLYLIFALSILSTLLFLIVGLIVGFNLSPVTELKFVFKNIEFVGAYFLQVLSVLMFSFLISLWVKRSGFTIALLIFWNYIVENIMYGFNAFLIQTDRIDSWLLSEIFPMEAASNLIREPFSKYITRPFTDSIAMSDLILVSVWLAFYFFMTHRYLQRKDL